MENSNQTGCEGFILESVQILNRVSVHESNLIQFLRLNCVRASALTGSGTALLPRDLLPY